MTRVPLHAQYSSEHHCQVFRGLLENAVCPSNWNETLLTLDEIVSAMNHEQIPPRAAKALVQALAQKGR